ncbi:MAG: ribosome maturation factor RimP [Chitinophagales bacterium]
MENLKEKIEKWLAPKLEMEELFLVAVEVGSNFRIQVFIDADDDSLNIRKCVRVSRDLEEHLDVDDEVAEKYTLDVSSPGLNNALRIPRQYKKLIGKTLKIKTYEEEDLVVKLLTVEEDFIEVKNTTIKDKSLKGRRPKLVIIDETPYKVEYKDIKKARLHFEI